jgi:hypothetical protein
MNEKRRFTRFPLFLPAVFYSSPVDQFIISCRIMDISEEGCRIDNLPPSLLTERQFKVKAYIPFDEKAVELKVMVQWSARRGERGCAGCTIEETTQEEKACLLDLAYKKCGTEIPRHAN